MQWSAGPDLGAARSYCAAAILADGKIIVAGGITPGNGSLSSTEVLATGIPAPLQPGPAALPDAQPAILAPVPDCTDMPAAEMVVHFESWLTAAELVAADPEQAKEAGRTKLRAACDGTIGAARAEKDQALQAARARRDREIADSRAKFNTTSTRVAQTLQTKRAAAETVRDQRLEQFNAKADTEEAELLPEIEKVRADKAEAVKLAASLKRRSDSGVASTSKRPRQDAPRAAPECGICMDRPPDTAFMTGSKSNSKGCGHMACGPCAEKLTECHVCRVKIVSKSKLFF
jgi:hypothetical protein